MKQLALVFLVVSPLLAIFTTIIHEIHTYIDIFDAFYPAVDTYLKFHQLSYVIGFILLAISISNRIDRVFLVLIALSLFTLFALYELKITTLFSWGYTFLSVFFLGLLSIYIKIGHTDNKHMKLYNSYLFMISSVFYSFILILYTLFSIRFIEIYLFGYLLLQFGLFTWFISWYKSEFSLSSSVVKED